ncbi:MAG: hypothetical protein GWP08_15295 [Nitrospiraceae bacterium]|nr:hypothetical protein [Nitrospiraceae bacterium]
MKKTRCAVLVVAVLALVPGVSSALDVEGCAEVVSMDGQLSGTFDLLGFAGVDDLGATWQDTDMESVLGVMDGDGIPDWYQMGLLGATMCSAGKDAAGVVAQFDANVVLFQALLAQLVAVFDGIPGVAPDMISVGDDLIAWAGGLPDDGGALQALKEGAIELGTQLGGAGVLFQGFVSKYGVVVTVLLPDLADGFSALGGLSTEGKLTVLGLLDNLFGEMSTYSVSLVQLAQGLAGVVAGAAAVDGTPYEMPAQLKADAMALAEALAGPAFDGAAGLAAILGAVDAAPNFVIYDLGAKAAGETFSAAGKYDPANALTNGEIFDAMESAGADMTTDESRALWVGAVSGSADFWPGNPDLPVAGVAGLVALAVALGGAAVMRKK